MKLFKGHHILAETLSKEATARDEQMMLQTQTLLGSFKKKSSSILYLSITGWVVKNMFVSLFSNTRLPY